METLELKFGESTKFQLVNATPYNFYVHLVGNKNYICSLKGCLLCKEHTKNNKKLRIYKIAFLILDYKDNKYKLLVLNNQSYRKFKAATKREQHNKILIQNIVYTVKSYGIDNLYFNTIGTHAPAITTAYLPPVREYFPAIPTEQQRTILQGLKK